MRKLILVLFLITAITALALGGVNYITFGLIAKRNEERTAEAMKEVLPADNYRNFGFDGVYEAEQSPGQTGGFVFEITSTGFGGEIQMVVGINMKREITGVSIVSMSESSGLGDNAKDAEWRAQFIGKSEALSVSGDGGVIDALTGATITSRAVVDGVNEALDKFTELMESMKQ
jgi:electron transport complex protein RnfG